MHYGDKEQLENSRLEFIIYKYSVSGSQFRRNKNGITSRRCVDYQFCSILKCEHFNPNILTKIIKEPYNYLARELDSVDFENFIKVTLKDLDGHGNFRVEEVKVVSMERMTFSNYIRKCPDGGMVDTGDLNNLSA